MSLFIRLLNCSKKWEPVAIHMLQVFLPLLLWPVTSLGHRRGQRVIWEGSRCFQLCPTHFSKGGKTFSEEDSPPCISLVTGQLLLQKLSLKYENTEHVKYLNKRLEWWKHGKPQELISEWSLFKQDSTYKSKTINNQTRKPSVDWCYKGKWKRLLDLCIIATSLVALRGMCDSPRTGCVRRTTIYIRGVNKQ